MKLIYFIVINVIAVVAICGFNMLAFINNIEHSNAAYFWIVTYAFVIGCSIIGMNCRNQILRLEEIMSIKLSLDPTDEEEEELLKMDDNENLNMNLDGVKSDSDNNIEDKTDKPEKKKKLFKKKA